MCLPQEHAYKSVRPAAIIAAFDLYQITDH